MAKSATDLLVNKIDADIARLQEMRQYVIEHGTAPLDVTGKVRKPRGPNKKRGLPTLTDSGE